MPVEPNPPPPDPPPDPPFRVALGNVEIRGVVLNGKNVSAEVRLRIGQAVYTVLVSNDVAMRVGPFVGCRASLLLEMEDD